RSDDKGPEPESITTGELNDKVYAFIGLERANGIFIYELSNPSRPKPAGYIDIEALGEIGPEGLIFIKKSENTGWLVVTSEISNTVSLYEISIP
ncbi:MAG: choice-of-anchor I domain-containing protein, partial [Cycloclasticus sp.]